MPNLKKNLVHYIEFGRILLNEWEYIEKMFKIVIVLKKLIFMDNNDIIYDSFTLLFCWNIPVWI